MLCDLKSPIQKFNFAVIDVETTGLSPYSDRIIEIAIVYIDRGNKIDTDPYSELLNPGIPIPWNITAITGITTRQTRKARQFKQIADELKRSLEHRILVAHNSSFDLGFLNAEFKRCRRKPLSNTVLCTLKMSRHFFPDLENHRLNTVAHHLGVTGNNYHRALGDTLVTAQVFIESTREIETLGKLVQIAGQNN